MITFFLGPATGYLWLFFSSHWSGWQLQWLNSSVSDCFRTQWTKGLRGIIPTRNSTLLALDNVCRINGNILEAMISTYPVTYIYIHIFTIKPQVLNWFPHYILTFEAMVLPVGNGAPTRMFTLVQHVPVESFKGLQTENVRRSDR